MNLGTFNFSTPPPPHPGSSVGRRLWPHRANVWRRVTSPARLPRRLSLRGCSIAKPKDCSDDDFAQALRRGSTVLISTRPPCNGCNSPMESRHGVFTFLDRGSILVGMFVINPMSARYVDQRWHALRSTPRPVLPVPSARSARKQGLIIGSI